MRFRKTCIVPDLSLTALHAAIPTRLSPLLTGPGVHFPAPAEGSSAQPGQPADRPVHSDRSAKTESLPHLQSPTPPSSHRVPGPGMPLTTPFTFSPPRKGGQLLHGNQLNVKILSVRWFVIQLDVASHHDVLGFDFNFFFF